MWPRSRSALGSPERLSATGSRFAIVAINSRASRPFNGSPTGCFAKGTGCAVCSRSSNTTCARFFLRFFWLIISVTRNLSFLQTPCKLLDDVDKICLNTERAKLALSEVKNGPRKANTPARQRGRCLAQSRAFQDYEL